MKPVPDSDPGPALRAVLALAGCAGIGHRLGALALLISPVTASPITGIGMASAGRDDPGARTAADAFGIAPRETTCNARRARASLKRRDGSIPPGSPAAIPPSKFSRFAGS